VSWQLLGAANSRRERAFDAIAPTAAVTSFNQSDLILLRVQEHGLWRV